MALIKYYINLTNGIERIPYLEERNIDYGFIRIQSTYCEQKEWDKLLQDLDYDFLMNLAIGNICVVFDYGANKPRSRAIYQGIEFIRYVLSKRWLNVEYQSSVSRSNKDRRGLNTNRYFDECYQKLNCRTKRKLDYFKPFINTGAITIVGISEDTKHDNDKGYYLDIIKSSVTKERDIIGV